VDGFIQMFRLGAGGDTSAPAQEEFIPPAWFGPPDNELGAVLPLTVVLARSDKAVVALRFVTVYSMGLTLDFLAAGRGLRERDAQRMFHEQFISDPDEGLPEGFLRIGIEFPDGQRASNLSDRRHFWPQPERAPEGPVLVQSGGGTGREGAGRVTMNPVYWLWPFPSPGVLKLFVEWPALGIALSSADLDGEAILAAAAQSERLWPTEE
jgi:hypothetical protein